MFLGLVMFLWCDVDVLICVFIFWLGIFLIDFYGIIVFKEEMLDLCLFYFIEI